MICVRAPCSALWWPAFWCLRCPGIRLKALHALLRTDLSKLSPALRFTVKIRMSDCFLLQLSGTWQNLASDVGMNLAKANIEAKNLADTCGGSKASMRLPEDGSSAPAYPADHTGFCMILALSVLAWDGSWALIKTSISSRKYGNRQLLCPKIWSNLHNKVRQTPRMSLSLKAIICIFTSWSELDRQWSQETYQYQCWWSVMSWKSSRVWITELNSACGCERLDRCIVKQPGSIHRSISAGPVEFTVLTRESEFDD